MAKSANANTTNMFSAFTNQPIQDPVKKEKPAAEPKKEVVKEKKEPVEKKSGSKPVQQEAPKVEAA